MSHKYFINSVYQHGIHNFLINAEFSLSEPQCRIFLDLLRNVKHYDIEFRTIRYSKADLMKLTKLDSLPKLRAMFEDFASRKIRRVLSPLEQPGKTEVVYEVRNWVTRATEYTNGVFEVSFTPEMADFLLDLVNKGNFTMVEVESMFKMNMCARRIYMFAKQNLNLKGDAKGKRIMPIMGLIKSMELSDYYQEYYHLSQKILKPAQKQINEISDIEISILPDKATRLSKGGYRNIIIMAKRKDGRVQEVQEDAVNMPLTQKTLDNGEYVGGKNTTSVWKTAECS